MDTKVNAVVEVPVEAIREIVVTAIRANMPGHVEEAAVEFDIHTETEGFGHSEVDRSMLRSAQAVVRGPAVQEDGMTVTRSARVTMSEAEIRTAIAAHVAARLKLEATAANVELKLQSRFQGDIGFEGPYLLKAVVTVENV